MKKAIVAGANGFVGSNVCKVLDDRGYKIIALVRDEESNISTIEDIQNVDILYLPMSNYNMLSKVITDSDIDLFFDFAWEGSAGDLRGDERVQTKNIEYTCDAIKEASKLHIKKFIYSGSIMEYEVMSAMEKELPVTKNMLYSTAKLTADYMAGIIASYNKIEYIRTIISNIYGPGEINSRFINSTIVKMLKGDHCSFSSGEQKYDFIYITDAARAFLDVAERGKAGKVYYIGNTEQKKLKEYIYELRDVVNPDMEPGLGELQMQGELLSYEEFDTSRLESELGFKPEVSFSDGIRYTRDWLMNKI